jgi:hypothetical protein
MLVVWTVETAIGYGLFFERTPPNRFTASRSSPAIPVKKNASLLLSCAKRLACPGFSRARPGGISMMAADDHPE